MSTVLVLAILVVLALLWIRQRRNLGAEGGGPTKGKGQGRLRGTCSWSETGSRNGRFVEYRCGFCHMVAYSRDGAPPKYCKKEFRYKGM